jgi:hypothetical protein
MRLSPHVMAMALALHEQRERIRKGLPPRKAPIERALPARPGVHPGQASSIAHRSAMAGLLPVRT